MKRRSTGYNGALIKTDGIGIERDNEIKYGFQLYCVNFDVNMITPLYDTVFIVNNCYKIRNSLYYFSQANKTNKIGYLYAKNSDLLINQLCYTLDEIGTPIFPQIFQI